MGIRFYCPNGHKLNVKEFQAGKKGVCPHCGVKIQIPTASTRPPSGRRNGRGRPAASPAAEEPAEVTDGDRPDAAWTPRPASDRADQTSGSIAVPEGRIGDSSELLPVEGAAADDVGNPAPAVPAARSAHAGLPNADRLSGGPAATDPLAEAGNAVWYVCPASGGQFGPAGNEVMRTWLQQGRVGADAMVWREGWPDWRPAAGVFPQLGAQPSGGGLPQIAVDEAPLSSTLHHHRTGSRRRSRSNQATVFVVLVVVVLILSVVFFLVVTRATGGETARAVEPSSAAQCHPPRVLLPAVPNLPFIRGKKVTGTFCLKGPLGASHKRCLSPSSSIKVCP